METERTHWHRKVERWLDELGIAYISECKDFYPYSCDVFLPEYHACVEIDGPSHTPTQDSKRSQNLLDNYCIPTLRLDARKGLTVARTKQRMMKAITEWCMDVEQRKAEWRQKTSR